MTITVGLAIGQKHSPTALCVVERVSSDPETRSQLRFEVRFLEQLPAGASYPQVATRLGVLVSGIGEHTHEPAHVYVDVTGRGAPIIDLLEKEVPGVRITACYFTHGDRIAEDGQDLRVGKGLLVTKLQTLLQAGLIGLPKTPESAIVAKDLLAYEIQVQEDANDRYGAFRVGNRDDIVTAIGLAVCHRPPRPTFYG